MLGTNLVRGSTRRNTLDVLCRPISEGCLPPFSYHRNACTLFFFFSRPSPSVLLLAELLHHRNVTPHRQSEHGISAVF